jgi:hypothetical protein
MRHTASALPGNAHRGVVGSFDTGARTSQGNALVDRVEQVRGGGRARAPVISPQVVSFFAPQTSKTLVRLVGEGRRPLLDAVWCVPLSEGLWPRRTTLR